MGTSDEHDETAGLAHVATVSFLAARAMPSGAFWLSLAGGSALARTGSRHGTRQGYGASLAAVLQTVAIMGPARINAPLTQALSAPLLGSMQARSRSRAARLAACLAIRLAHYTVLSVLVIYVIFGIDAYAGSYDTLTGWLGILPQGEQAALAVTAVNNFLFAVGFSVIQVLVYERALGRWPPAMAAEPVAAAVVADPPPVPGRFDPRALTVSAVLASGLLLSSISWPMLAAVAAWLALVAATTRLEREFLAVGAALAVLLGVGALAAGLIGGIGLDEAARRGVRALLLVAVATWLRAAAGTAGLRAAFRRALGRLRRVPAAGEAQRVLDRLDSGSELAAAGRSLASGLDGVPTRPLPIADAVIAWVAHESQRVPRKALPALPLQVRPRDVVIMAASLLPAITFAF